MGSLSGEEFARGSSSCMHTVVQRVLGVTVVGILFLDGASEDCEKQYHAKISEPLQMVLRERSQVVAKTFEVK